MLSFIIYLFILAVRGLHCCPAYSPVAVCRLSSRWLLLLWKTGSKGVKSSSSCGMWAQELRLPGSRAQARELRLPGSRAQARELQLPGSRAQARELAAPGL